MFYGNKKEVAVFTDFNKRQYGLYLGTILFKNYEYSFDEWYNTEGIIFSDKSFVKLYCYNGFPCGEPRKIYSKDYKIMNEHFSKDCFKKIYSTNDLCLPIEQLYIDAEKWGFNKEHIDSFINEEIGYWLYEDDKLVKQAKSWSWNYE